MLAEESEPQAPQRVGAGHHHFHQPAGMSAGVIGKRKLQDVLEKRRSHYLILTVREPIRMERNQRAGEEGKKREANPGAEQELQAVPIEISGTGLAVGQGIDDAAEQDGFYEQGAGQVEVGDG